MQGSISISFSPGHLNGFQYLQPAKEKITLTTIRCLPWSFLSSHGLHFSCLNSDTFADLFVSWWYGIWIPNFESRLKLHRLGWSDHFVVIKRWQHYKMGIILVCWLFTLHLPSPFLRSATSNKHKTTHLDLEGIDGIKGQGWLEWLCKTSQCSSWFSIFIWTMLISKPYVRVVVSTHQSNILLKLHCFTIIETVKNVWNHQLHRPPTTSE